MPMKNMPSQGLLKHHIVYLFRHSQAVKGVILNENVAKFCSKQKIVAMSLVLMNCNNNFIFFLYLLLCSTSAEGL